MLRYYATCPCCGKKLCVVNGCKGLQIQCTHCKVYVDVNVENGKVIVQQVEPEDANLKSAK